MDERVPPQDLDAEMALLGSIMMDRNALEDGARIIGTAEAFYLPSHQELFRVLDVLRVKRTAGGQPIPIDLIVVCDALRKLDKLEFVGGQEYMVQLAESFGDWHNAEHYARIVWETYTRRQMIRLAGRIVDKAYCRIDDIDGEPTRLANELAELEVVHAEAILDVQDVLDSLHTVSRSKRFVKTGFFPFDTAGGGIQRGALTVIAGRPSTGKSALVLNLAREAIVDDEKVIVFSLEMSATSMCWRLVAMISGTPSLELEHAASEDQLALAVKATKGDFPRHHLGFVDRGGSFRDLLPVARNHVRSHGASLVIWDYLQLMKPGVKFEREDQGIAYMTRELKLLAHESGAAVVLLSQLNRQGANVKPQLWHLMGSGQIEANADIVWMLWRNEAKDPGSYEQTKVYIRKYREGPLMNFNLVFHRPTQRFSLAKPTAVATKETENGKG